MGENQEELEDRVAWPPPGYRSGDDVLDAPIQATHLDAAGAKKVCADLGYFDDPILRDIVPGYICGRKSPMIHRGYYVRTMAMRRAVEMFVKNADPSSGIQIVDLGSGLDTLYWYVTAHMKLWGREDVTFFEVDFPVIISKKTRTIKHKQLCGPTPETSTSKVHHVQQIHTANYRMASCDMRQTEEFKSALFDAGFDGTKNTLFLAECVLVYLQASFSDDIISICRGLCTNPDVLTEFVVYEQCNPDTNFGRQMVKNLRERGCALMGLDKYATIDDQKKRYVALGWDRTAAYTLNQHYDRTVDDIEAARLAKLELLDEIEEFRLIMDHYFLLVATNGPRYDPKVIF